MMFFAILIAISFVRKIVQHWAIRSIVAKKSPRCKSSGIYVHAGRSVKSMARRMTSDHVANIQRRLTAVAWIISWIV